MNNFYETSIEFSSFDQMKKTLKDAIFKGNENGIKYENIIFSGDRTNI